MQKKATKKSEVKQQPKKELTYDEQVVQAEEKRVANLLKKGYFYTEWGELAPPIVEIDNKKEGK